MKILFHQVIHYDNNKVITIKYGISGAYTLIRRNIIINQYPWWELITQFDIGMNRSYKWRQWRYIRSKH